MPAKCHPADYAFVFAHRRSGRLAIASLIRFVRLSTDESLIGRGRKRKCNGLKQPASEFANVSRARLFFVEIVPKPK